MLKYISLGLIGTVFQLIGILIILISQVEFWFRTHKEYGSLQKAFLSMSFPKVGLEKEKLKRLSMDELKEIVDKLPLAGLLYEDFKISVIGIFFTLIGMIIALIETLYFNCKY